MADKTQLDDHLNKAEGYLMLGMYEDALHEAAAAVEIEPASYAANYLCGVALISLKRFDEAEEPLMEAVALAPERPDALVHLAYVHRRIVSLDKAIETIRKAVERKPDMAIANYNLACYYALKGDAEEALRYLRRAINAAPSFRDVAREDEDFESLTSNDEFRRLVEIGE